MVEKKSACDGNDEQNRSKAKLQLPRNELNHST